MCLKWLRLLAVVLLFALTGCRTGGDVGGKADGVKARDSKWLRVTLNGDVAQPGQYAVPRGGTVGDLVRRAGGLGHGGELGVPPYYFEMWRYTGKEVERFRVVFKDTPNWTSIVLEDGDLLQFPAAVE